MRKLSIKLLLLAFLKNLGEASLAVIDEGFLNPRYSFTGPTRALLGLPLRPDYKKDDRPKRQSFSVILYRLKKDGLVANKGPKKYAQWFLTKKGFKFVAGLDKGDKEADLAPRDGRIRVVCFDIPERQRWKRSKLRFLLRMNDYDLLQQSIWIGDRPLKKEVLSEMRSLKLIRHIHIFEIFKRGTLCKLKAG